jgi:hypothetical protein
MSVVPVASHSVGTAKARMRLMRRERFSSEGNFGDRGETTKIQLGDYSLTVPIAVSALFEVKRCIMQSRQQLAHCTLQSVPTAAVLGIPGCIGTYAGFLRLALRLRQRM